MAKALKKGDKVEWNASQGKAKGRVKKKLTSTVKIKGHTASASKAKPEYLVESEKTGKKAAHKAEALKKTKAASKPPAKAPAKQKTKPSATSWATAPKKKTASAPSKKTSKSAKGSPRPSATKKTASAKRAAPKSKKLVPTAAKKPLTKKPAASKAPKVNTDQVIKEFRAVVNLTPSQLERWLSLPDSKKLGFKDEVKAGTIGHESGRRILKILAKRRDKYTEDDLRHMQTVVGFVNSHRAQKPPGDIVASNWRYSLMNWGHDPTKYKPARGKA